MAKQLKRLFIANRGEICRRIATTAQMRGMETVTISWREPAPLFLRRLISTFVPCPNESENPYLQPELLVTIAKDQGCDCIHPGFGFLSENAQFATICQKAGLTWVGPHPESMEAMASKDHARRLALEAGVPCNEALQGLELDKDTQCFTKAKRFAADLGYPVLVKAAYGGGGKGMRLVKSESELEEAMERCTSEAKSAFGNGTLLVERYLQSPRHVEVQIVGDQHGHYLAVGDRDCSIQRRHQKIIEEAPAPGLTEKTRTAMHDAAIKLAERVRYDSVGTVEFLLDASQKTRSGEVQSFFFLEMNTRLQVEHPVSEEVFGVDLVELQFLAAEKKSIELKQNNLCPQGHSIEARIYAEDSANGFLPSPGFVHMFSPYHGKGIRWEVGMDAIAEISPQFDPMIAKVIATGSDRKSAIRTLSYALRNSYVMGPEHNIPYLVEVLNHNDFIGESLSTHFIEQHHETLLKKIKTKRQSSEELAKSYLDWLRTQSQGVTKNATDQPTIDRTKSVFSKRADAPNKTAAHKSISSREISTLSRAEHTHHEFRRKLIAHGIASDPVQNLTFSFVISRSPEESFLGVGFRGFSYHVKIAQSSLSQASEELASEDDLVAPVPGKVIKVLANNGEAVDEDSVLFVLESMKMEFEVRANKAGTIAQCLVEVGDQVGVGEQLASWQDKD